MGKNVIYIIVLTLLGIITSALGISYSVPNVVWGIAVGVIILFILLLLSRYWRLTNK